MAMISINLSLKIIGNISIPKRKFTIWYTLPFPLALNGIGEIRQWFSFKFQGTTVACTLIIIIGFE